MSNPAPASAPKLSLRRRLNLVILLVALVSVLAATGIANHFARQNLETSAFETLTAVRDGRAAHILDTYATIEAQVLELAMSHGVRAAVRELGASMRELPEDLGWSDEEILAARTSLQAFYDQVRATAYERVTGDTLATAGLAPQDVSQVAAQQIYVATNPHDFGEKEQVDLPSGDTTRYGARHAAHHPALRRFMHRFGYYDLFLVDPEGVVVYSVEKEVDFATSLREGPYRNSGLARAALQALRADGPGAVFLTDYAAYEPSNGAPAAFVAAPVFHDGASLGALVLQMPIGWIDRVMNSDAGLGQTGETYLVGKDGRMRSDSRFEDTPAILRVHVDTQAVRQALANETGRGLIRDYRGVPVLSAWKPLEVLGLHYALIAEIDESEAFAPARRVFWTLLGLAGVLGIAALGISVWIASTLARPVGAATESLEVLAQHLLSESQEQQAGAAEQSAAAEETRQTFHGLLEASTHLSRIGTDVLGHAEVSQKSSRTIGDRIEELSSSAATIGEVLALVEEIANKTDILALNAALEGTKVGEAGRGFSLVAQQMQRLASQVMDSVKQIEGLTRDISSSSRAAVLAADQAGTVSRKTTEAARDIASAVGVQQSGAEQVATAMDEIAQVAGRNVEATRHVVASSGELIELAARLRAIVGVKA